jgi:hypothetical protein
MLALLFSLSLLAVTDSIPAPRLLPKLEWIKVDLSTMVTPAPPTVQAPPIRDVYQYPVGICSAVMLKHRSPTKHVPIHLSGLLDDGGERNGNDDAAFAVGFCMAQREGHRG